MFHKIYIFYICEKQLEYNSFYFVALKKNYNNKKVKLIACVYERKK